MTHHCPYPYDAVQKTILKIKWNKRENFSRWRQIAMHGASARAPNRWVRKRDILCWNCESYIHTHRVVALNSLGLLKLVDASDIRFFFSFERRQLHQIVSNSFGNFTLVISKTSHRLFHRVKIESINSYCLRHSLRFNLLEFSFIFATQKNLHPFEVRLTFWMEIVFKFIEIYSEFVLNRLALLACVLMCE